MKMPEVVASKIADRAWDVANEWVSTYGDMSRPFPRGVLAGSIMKAMNDLWFETMKTKRTRSVTLSTRSVRRRK